jgi:tight adherence protein C
MIILFLFLILIFSSITILVYSLISMNPPSADYGHKLTFLERFKEIIAVHKQVMKIKFINKRVSTLWIELGKPNNVLPEDIVVFKLICFAFVFILLWFFNMKLASIMFGMVAFFIPDFYFSHKAFLRLREIERSFPSALDLLTLCVDAGIDFMSALSKIIENTEQNPLMDEFQEIIREMQLGSDRKQAMKNFSDRCDLEIVGSFVSVVVQAEELGTSLSSVLKDYSAEMKIKRFQSAEKQAMEAPVKMLIPMMIFIFPGVFILIFGPIAIQLMEMI